MRDFRRDRPRASLSTERSSSVSSRVGAAPVAEHSLDSEPPSSQPEVAQSHSLARISLYPGSALPSISRTAMPLLQRKDDDAPAPAMDGGTVQQPPDLSGRGSLQLHARAKELAAQFEQPDPKPMQRFLIARELVLITDELNRRGGDQLLAKTPDYKDEIWQVAGGPGDPLVGQLDSFREPYTHINTYRKAVAELDPKGWDSDALNKAYTANPTGGARATNFNTPVEEARSMIGKTTTVIKDGKRQEKEFSPPIKSASEWAQEKGQSQVVLNPGYKLTGPDLRFIIGDKHIANEGLTDAQVNAALDRYADFLNDAFRLAKIDTVQGQASYLAHSAGETSLARFSEGQVGRWQDDPSKITYSSADSGPMDYSKHSTNAELRSSTGTVDPAEVIESKDKMKKKSQEEVAAIFGQTFIGRGPVQVTHDYNYTQTLIYMEELAKSAASKEDSDKIWEAVQAIKKDPAQAANPQYAFLFSAAYMQKTGGVRASGSLGQKVTGITFDESAQMTGDQHALFDWVSGGINVASRGAKSDGLGKSVKEASTRKVETYGRAYQRIMDGINAMQKK